jgi:sensor c-di-GMP phosphodiesterase-like protein
VISSILGALAAGLPILGMLWVTWSLARADEQRLLDTVTERLLVRAARSAKEAETAIDRLAQSNEPPCSPRSIGFMQSEVFNTLTIEEMGYFEGGVLRCTSWGNTGLNFPATRPDFQTQSGLDVTLSVRPALRDGTPKLAYRKGAYNALVDPARFVDVITERKLHMAVATRDGRVFAQTDGAGLDVLRDLAAQESSLRDDRYASSIARSRDWIAVAVEPRPPLFATVRREQLVMFPLALFLAAVMVSTVVWFSRRRLSLRGEIETAVHRKEFTVHYQPLIDLKSGTCIGAEALVRWQRPDRSWIRPDLFIPVAEQSGLIQKITGLVIDEIGRDIGILLASNPYLHIAINLAAADLSDGSFLPLIEKMVREHALRPDQIWLEATERGLLKYDIVSETISRARNTGYVICIDDFGTGYSSLQHLQHLEFDVLKIDKSFVDSIGVSSPKSAVINHIIEMAKSLHVSIVAEGVERPDQAEYLNERHVDFGQGWLFSRALARDDFVSFVSRSRADLSGYPGGKSA